MHFTRKMKLALATIGTASASVFAQEGGSVSIDTTTAEASINAVGTAITGLITGPITTQLGLVIAAGLTIAFMFFGVRWLLRGGKTAAR